MITGRRALTCSAPAITQLVSIASRATHSVDVVGADVQGQQRDFPTAVVLSQEALRSHDLRAARRVAAEQQRIARVTAPGEKACRGLASAAQLDQSQARDLGLLDRVQLVGVALVGVDGEAGGVGLHALCQ
jgi:hypothetical protein